MLVQLLAFVQQTFTCLLHLYSGCYANIFIFILFGDLMPQLTGYLLVDIVQNSTGSCSSCCFRKKKLINSNYFCCNFDSLLL